jgi:mono/diheme cytochrome c family protein
VTKRRLFFLSALLLSAALLPGCNDTAYPEDLEYRYEDYQSWEETKQQMKFVTVSDKKEEMITEALRPYFGTPRSPTVYLFAAGQEDAPQLPGEGKLRAEDKKVLHSTQLQLDDKTLALGSKVYRQQCLHCHGLMGNGEGPTGQFLNPRPRDFRRGIFKFISTAIKTGTDSNGKPVFETNRPTLPSRKDLLRTLRNGIPTASMPAFNLLPDDQLEALVSYIIHLSLRGQVERALVDEKPAKVTTKANKARTGYTKAVVEAQIKQAVENWVELSASDYEPPAPTKDGKPISWEALHEENQKTQRGRTLYLGNGGCVQCHGRDGQATFYEVKDNINRRDPWGNLNAPRNLALGHFRGGSRPIDVYYRIKLGIGGSLIMPAADTTKLKDEDIWYIVDYVLSLPQERVAKK